jgi:hypothetical protein
MLGHSTIASTQVDSGQDVEAARQAMEKTV